MLAADVADCTTGSYDRAVSNGVIDFEGTAIYYGGASQRYKRCIRLKRCLGLGCHFKRGVPGVNQNSWRVTR